MHTVLIAGANGFIGRALCERMLANGWHVRGAIRSAKRAEMLPPKLEPVIVESIDQHTDWSKALNGVDSVVHLAARVHVMNESVADPPAAFRQVNVQGTKRLAQQAVDANVRRFFFMSSIKVNGEGTGGQSADYANYTD